MDYALLRPAPGKTHAPNTTGGPWTYQYGSEFRSIFRAGSQEPRPMPVEEGAHAFAYFTIRGASGSAEELVTMEVCTGALELQVAGTGQVTPVVYPCSIEGCEFSTGDFEEFRKHIVECATKNIPTGPKEPKVRAAAEKP